MEPLEGVEEDGQAFVEDNEWVPTLFVHEPPKMKVTQPRGSFCQIEARFSVPLPPDEVFGIITDPNNRRVFKNVKEVTYRKVLEDDGNRQLVELEQVARWRFLVFSGTFTSRVFVEQNREQHSMYFDLAKQGMMKQFSGSWHIDTMEQSDVDAPATSENNPVAAEKWNEKNMGSWVSFRQVVEPAVVPPWPLSNYVRSVTAKIVGEILADLQRATIEIAQSKSNRVPE